MSLDTYDFARMSGSGFGAIATDAQLVSYFKQIATANNYSSTSSLSNKIQGTRNWVSSNKDQSHPLWKYADIQIKSGDRASNDAINADINRLKSQIFTSAAPPPPPPPTPPAPSPSPDVNSAPYKPETPATTSSKDGEGLLSKKNLMIAGGAVAAIGLAFVLIK